MRHQKAGRKLGRTSSHRRALLRTLVTQFFDRERIITTLPKAKELRPLAEKIITLAKNGSLHARRQALAVVRRKSIVAKLFADLAPRFADRNGGYTRIIRLGVRKGDASERAVIELLGSEYKPPKVEKKGKGAKKEKAEAAETKAAEKAEKVEKVEKTQKAEKAEKKAKKPAKHTTKAAAEKEKAVKEKARKPAKTAKESGKTKKAGKA
jgi:large subunit ribosomal protein L17